MKISDHYYSSNSFLTTCLAKLSKLIFIVVLMFAKTTLAETEFSDIDNADAMKPAREVDIGAGGNVKLERKYRTKVESLYEWHTHLLWESRYVTEGRDNLSGHGLLSASTEFSVDEFYIIPWLADSIGVDYSEFNLNVIYGSKLSEDIILYTGYNFVHAEFLGERASDNEISLDLAYKWIKHVNALASIDHSFDAAGSFMEVALKYNNKINSKLLYSMQGVLGANAGYVVDGHDGLNHF